MELQRIETRAIEVAQAALKGRPTEDDRVELKAVWPEAGHKTARQIAGHANACGAASIMWLIGVDERRRRLNPVDNVELSNWWTGVSKWFAGEVPGVRSLVVTIEPGCQVVVLYFDTARTPYLVTTREGGQVQRELPWREGNSTRTAHRHEVLRSVLPQVTIPQLEVITASISLDEWVRKDSGRVSGQPQRGSDGAVDDEYGNEVASKKYRLAFNTVIFISAHDPVTLPQHRQILRVSSNNTAPVDLRFLQAQGTYRYNGFGQSGQRRREPVGNIGVIGDSGLDIRGSGEVELTAHRDLPDEDARSLRQARRLMIDLVMPVDLTERSTYLSVALRYRKGSRDQTRYPVGYPDRWSTVARFIADGRVE